MRIPFLAAIAACVLTSTSLIGNVMAQQAGHTDQHQGQIRPLTPEEMVFQSSKLSDLAVHDTANKKLGSLDNLIIDAHAGQVLYGILDTGFGGKKIPVPWTAMRLERSGKTFFMVLNKNKGQLANAPTFDKDRMQDVVDPRWQKTVQDFFGVRSVARPVEPGTQQKHEMKHDMKHEMKH
jgi:hypothetical protein